MQKIKNSILDRMIACRLNNKEIDFLLYVSRFQDQYGKVCGVYYKDVCRKMDMSCQEFYNVKESLEKKNFIRCEKSNWADHDITIIGNFEEECLKEGYISTNHNIFYQKEFWNLKAGAKLLAMYLMKVTYAGRGYFKISTRKFYDKKEGYSGKFGVTARVLRGYLMSLKGLFFSIGIKDGLYYIEPLKCIYRKMHEKSEQKRYEEHHVESICRRVKIKEAAADALRDVETLFHQYRQRTESAGCSIMKLMEKAVRRSLEVINSNSDGKIKKRELRASLVHKMLKEEIEKKESKVPELPYMV